MRALQDHIRRAYAQKTTFFIVVMTSFVSRCVDVNDRDVVEVVKALPEANVQPNATAAGTVSHCSGLNRHSTSFWVQNRRSDAPRGMDAYSRITADCRGSSAHFVLYRQQCASCSTWLSNPRAQKIVDALEKSYVSLRYIYGNGNAPDVQKNGGKIVILAYNIEDDYSSRSNAFIAGFFAPKDLFADSYTSAFYTNRRIIQENDALTIAERKGRSNENNLIYLDLDPLLSGVATNANISEATKMAIDTALHELTHLFVYNHRKRSRGLPMHNLWITEGSAEIGPALLAGSTAAKRSRLQDWGNPIVQEYLAQSKSLINWKNSSSALTSGRESSLVNLANYTQSYLFFNYIQHITSPIGTMRSFMSDLMGSKDSTYVGLDRLLGTHAQSNLKDVFTDYVVSLGIYSRKGPPVKRYIDSNTNGEEAGSGAVFYDHSLHSALFTEKMAKFGFKESGIGSYGEPGVSFPRPTLPFSFGDVGCLPATSYRYTRLTLSANANEYIQFPSEVSSNQQTLTISGFDPRMRLYTLRENAYNSATSGALSLQLTRFKLDSGKAVISLNNVRCGSGNACKMDIHFMLVNPETSGGCISVPKMPSNPRNVTDWAGGGKNSWNKSPGADLGYRPGYFFRQSGVAAVRDPGANDVYGDSDDIDYLFVGDRTQHTVSRFNFRTGSFEGRLGARPGLGNGTSVPCSDNGLDFFNKNDNGIASGNCRSLLRMPRAVKVVKVSNTSSPFYPYYLLIADAGNSRIVRRSRTGAYEGSLGHRNYTNSFSPKTLEFVKPDSANYKDSKGLIFPTEIEVGNCDSSVVGVVPGYNHTDFQCLYIYDTVQARARVIRRLLDLRGSSNYDASIDGKYLGYIGSCNTRPRDASGYEYWNTVDTTVGGPCLNEQTQFSVQSSQREGLAVDDSYLYITEGEKDRISRVPLNGNFSQRKLLGGKSAIPSWHTAYDTQSGTNRYLFNVPTDIEVDSDFVYVSDSVNNRVVRVKKSTPSQKNDWSYIGTGFTQWESDDYTPSYFDFSKNCSTNPAPLAVDMCAPYTLGSFELKLDFIDSNSPMYGTGKTSIRYLLLSTIYHNRVSRWNLDCVKDNDSFIECRDY